jgi:hypothetical protein
LARIFHETPLKKGASQKVEGSSAEDLADKLEFQDYMILKRLYVSNFFGE